MYPSSTSTSNVFTWKIPKKDWSRLDEGECVVLQFETVAPTKGERIKWELNVYPQGMEYEDVKLFGVSLHLVEDCHVDKFQIETAYKIMHGAGDSCEPLDMSNSRSYLGFHSSVIDERGYQQLGESYEADEVASMADKKGMLTFQFEMRTFPAHREKFQSSAAKMQFLNKFKEVESEAGDVDLKCKGKRIPCHKFLLISQSPVFKAMFEHPSKESKENVVNIVDSTPSALKTFVRFLYSGNLVLGRLTPERLEHIFGVMNLANKYQVEILMDGCIDALMDIMNISNVLKILAVLDKVNAKDNVLEMAINFIKKNIRIVVLNYDWEEFVSAHPALVKDLLLNMNDELLYGSRN